MVAHVISGMFGTLFHTTVLVLRRSEGQDWWG